MNKETKNNKISLSSRKLVVFSIIVIFAIQFGILLKINNDMHKINDDNLAILKNQALIGFHVTQESAKVPVVDAINKKLYLPELSLYLPLTLASADLNYRITNVDGGDTVDIVFDSKKNSNIYSELHDNYICTELVRAEIGNTESKPRDDEVAQSPIRLDDGRLVQLYVKNIPSNCKTMPVLPKDIADVVARIHSY